jgi:hypothetical protein
LIESSSGKSKEKERSSEKRKEDSEEKIRRRFSQNQPCVSHLSLQPVQAATAEEGPVTPCYEVLQGVQIPKIQEFYPHSF